jgi:hypothetical protein
MAQGLISGSAPESVQPSLQTALESLTGSNEGNSVSVTLSIPGELASTLAENPDLLKTDSSR